MTMEMNVDIPASHRLTLEVPREVPEGKAKVVFTPLSTDAEGNWKPGVIFSPERKPRMTPQEALDRMCGMFADAKFSSDTLREERNADLEHEEAKYRRLFHKE
jgi:hypothetical protein